jgi:galactokinase
MIYAGNRATDAFEWAWGRPPEVLARAPGRVNLIGEHVDYNDGLVLPAAIDLDVAVAASPRHDRRVRVLAADLGEEAAFHLDHPSERRPVWTSYVQGVCALIQRTGIHLPGLDLAIAGDVPRGTGLSSSAALEVATAKAVLAAARRTLTDLEIVELCHRAESEWVGVHCGVMDTFASVFGETGHAIFLDCRTLACMPVPLPDEVMLVATHSGIPRGLQDSAYNERVAECNEAARLLRVRRLRDLTHEQFAERADALSDVLRRRARHVVTEIARTRDAAAALEGGATWRVGRYLNESHESLRTDFEVSTPELDALVQIARSIHGVYGSRLTGAGFGGCTLSLVARHAIAEFQDRVPAEYRRRTGNTATVYVLRASAGASLLPRPELHG